MDELKAITPLDGRYRQKVRILEEYFSEYALIRERVRIELAYLEKFIDTVDQDVKKRLPIGWRESLRIIAEEFSSEDAAAIKEAERIVGHDVVAVVSFLRERLGQEGLDILKPYVHIGLTSEDVNNLAYSALLKRFNYETLIPGILELVDKLCFLSRENIKVVMLARTHGQPAVPTTLGRFLANYAFRVADIAEGLSGISFPGKIGGAAGDYNALKFSYPESDWIGFGKSFVESLGLEYFPAFTQILPHERISEYLMRLSILDSILSNLCRDLWMMAMLGHIRFPPRDGEIHSSTMPHKSNPVLLENSEGALDLASEILAYMARRLMASRLHRDLSDSIIKRFYGLPMSLTYLGIKNLSTSLEIMEVDREAMAREVEKHPEILGEAYQVYLRRRGYDESYGMVRAAIMEDATKTLEKLRGKVPDEDLEHLSRLTPHTYVGEAERIAERLLERVAEIRRRVERRLVEKRL